MRRGGRIGLARRITSQLSPNSLPRCSAVRQARAFAMSVVRAVSAHHRGAEDAEVPHRVREAEAVDHVGLAVVAVRVP